MIESFPTYTAANTWIAEHPEWKPVSIIPGIGSGSLMVLFEAKQPIGHYLQFSGLRGPTTDDPNMAYDPNKPRRGRPPKVKA